MDYLELTNRVLRRLREDSVTSVTQTDYSTLIGDFINDAKREVEDAWDWSMLRTTITITTAAGTTNYALTGAGDRYHILHVQHADDNRGVLCKYPRDFVKTWLNYDPQPQQTVPAGYYVEGQSGGDPLIYFIPVPDGVYDIEFTVIVPQAELSDGEDELTVPWHPVLMAAYARAIEERGEDMGVSATSAARRAYDSLNRAIEFDTLNYMDELDWYAN